MQFLIWRICKADGVRYCDIYLPIHIQIKYGPPLTLHQRGMTLQITSPRLIFCLG